MGTINIYSSLSANKKIIKANGKLCDILPDYDFSKSLILNSGKKIHSDFEVQENDIIFIRAIPSGVTAAIIAVTVAVVAIGVGVGVGLYVNMNQELKEQQEKAQRDADNLAQQINQLPFIKGAKNKSALGNAVQYLIGSCYNTPYDINESFYSIGGEYGNKLYWNHIFSCGYGDQQITDILCGSQNILSNPAGISEGVHSVDSTSIFYDEENKIELCQSGTEFTQPEFTQKIVCVQDGAEIKHDYGEESEPLIRTLPDFTQKVEVCIQFSALRQYNSNTSAWEARLATVKPYWSNDNGNTWNEFYFDGMQNNSISLNKNRNIRFVASKTFTAAEAYGKQILIKVEKITPALESNSNEDCYLLFYQSYCYDNKLSSAEELIPCKPANNFLTSLTTRLAVRFIANDNTKEILDEFHTIGCGLARIWDSTTQTWSTEKYPTRNPAAWLLEIATSPIHKHSQYKDEELDLESFGELYEYCEEEEFYCDAVLTKGEKKETIFSNILSTVNADFIENYTTGKKEIVIDKKEDYPIALLTAQNIRSINYAKNLERKPDGQKITFTNRDNWQIDTMYCMLHGGEKTADDVVTELNLNYVTTSKHAYKVGQRKMREQVLQPKTFTVKVGKEGDYYPLYKTIALQLERFKIGLKSSVIHNLIYSGNYIAGLEIGDAVEFEAHKRYGAIIQAQNDNGKRLISKEIIGNGKTRTIYFSSVLEPDGDVMPEAYNQLTIGELDENGDFSKVTNIMKIVGCNVDGPDGYSLTVKDYNPAMYEYGEIPVYKSNLTSRNTISKQTITDIKKDIQNSIIESVEQAKSEISADAVRKLSSLDEIGTEGEIATYQGNVYIYHSGVWTKANAQGYLGLYMNDAPSPAADCFFLAGANFKDSVGLLTNKGILSVNQGFILTVNKTYEKGVIYTSDGIQWKPETNKNDWRYLIATNDQASIGGEISPGLEAATVGKVYKETGLDALENVKFIDEKKRLIKAKFIDTEAIKASQGFFDDITVNGDYTSNVLNTKTELQRFYAFYFEANTNPYIYLTAYFGNMINNNTFGEYDFTVDLTENEFIYMYGNTRIYKVRCEAYDFRATSSQNVHFIDIDNNEVATCGWHTESIAGIYPFPLQEKFYAFKEENKQVLRIKELKDKSSVENTVYSLGGILQTPSNYNLFKLDYEPETPISKIFNELLISGAVATTIEKNSCSASIIGSYNDEAINYISWNKFYRSIELGYNGSAKITISIDNPGNINAPLHIMGVNQYKNSITTIEE